MRHTSRIVAALAFATLMAACDDSSTAPLTTPTTPAEADIQRAARAVALGMENEAARLAVRDAMRDSPWNEHKLVFQEFIATPAGARLLSAAAAASGQSVEELRGAVAGLPELDFYVPSREQRLSWQGTPGVAVAATLELDDTTVPGFDSRGRSLASALTANTGAVILLAPSELRTQRIDPQPAGVGATIQAAGDGELGESLYTWTTADGKEITVRYQDLVEGKDPRFKPLMNHTTGEVTRVEHIAGYMNDGSSSWLELGIVANFYAPDGTFIAQAKWKKTGIPYDQLVAIREVLFTTHVIPDNGTARIQATLWELDDCNNFNVGCSNQDDNPYGTTNFYYNDRDVTKAISCPSGSSVCTSGALTGNLNLHWNARSASVFTGVSVSAHDIFVGDYGTATAKAVDQYGYPLSGYSVSSWSISDTSIASLTSTSGTSATYFGNDAGFATIYATISGVTGSASFYVEPEWGPCDPNDPFQIC